jgi:acetoacetyl-CoA synthetase
VSDPAHLEEGALLWEPTAAFAEASTLTDYRRWLERERGLGFDDYAALWRWSVDDLGAFWTSVVDYYDLPLRGGWEHVVAGEMPGVRWFEGATINYAEALLRRVSPDEPALLAQSERQPLREISGAEVTAAVAAVATGLRRLGVGRGDRVAAVIPNIPEAVVALLACASIGAIWSSCSPDFGTQSLVDRFAQIEPTVLIAVDGYTYGGRPFDRRSVIDELRAALPSLRRTVLIPYLDPDAAPVGADEMSWADLTSGPADPLTFEAVPFDHPLWVVYSSGTTGLPKAIVHGHGGIVLEHAKAVGLQFDVRAGDRMSWFTTTGWMMWNFLVGSMVVGGVPVLYDGSPGHPSLDVLWDLADRAGVSLFGTSAAFVGACIKSDLRPGDRHDLTALRSIGVTGSPLSPAGFGWVYDAVKPDAWLVSMSGGTDVCSAFVGGCPWLPVHAGELQARSLGARVEAFDPAGRSIVGATGELVLTAPLPSMPVFFWNDPDGTRYRESYFEMYPGVWRHGDWIRITERGSAIIEGRSDSTLNRQGIRFGTSELYSVVERLPEVVDSLVIGLELPNGGYWMPLFVVLSEGTVLDDELRGHIRTAIRTALSQRHVPDDIVAIGAVPRTLTGKKMEVPVKRLLLGRPLSEVAAPGAVADPRALDFFVEYAASPAMRARGATDAGASEAVAG